MDEKLDAAALPVRNAGYVQARCCLDLRTFAMAPSSGSKTKLSLLFHHFNNEVMGGLEPVPDPHREAPHPTRWAPGPPGAPLHLKPCL